MPLRPLPSPRLKYIARVLPGKFLSLLDSSHNQVRRHDTPLERLPDDREILYLS